MYHINSIMTIYNADLLNCSITLICIPLNIRIMILQLIENNPNRIASDTNVIQ
jgi:hypothetical protein